MIVFLVIVALYLYFPRERSEMVTVTRVIDGDTIVVEGGERVRLAGIDSQEEGEKCYEPAKKRMEELILKEQVRLVAGDKGKYGRTLGYIFYNGSLVNKKLVEEGLAVAYFYEDTDYRSEIEEAETRAMEANQGCEW